MFFAFLGKGPPGTWFAAFHKINDRHENIYHTGILPFARSLAKFSMQVKRVFSDQLLWMIDVNQAKVIRHCPTDVRKIFEL